MAWRTQWLRAADYRQVPWRNGGGVTAEIARGDGPATAAASGAGGPDFGWRLSVATVAASGPFSQFPGCERCIVQLSGARLRLSHARGAGESKADKILDLHAPYCFSGDDRTTAEIIGAGGETIRDFNCIVNSKMFTSHVAYQSLTGEPRHCTPSHILAVYALTGTPRARFGSEEWTLAVGDTLLVQAAPTRTVGAATTGGELDLAAAAGAASVLIVSLAPREPAHG